MSNESPTDDGSLADHFPDALREADEIDFDDLAAEIGKPLSLFEIPTTPGGEHETWVDELELGQAAARHIRDGGDIDIERVVVDSAQ